MLELLVAVAIIALFAVPMAMSIEMGLRSWRNTHEAIDLQERDLLVRDRVRVWLEGAYPHDVNRQLDQRRYPLTGTETSVQFVSAIHPDPQFDVLFDVTLALHDGNLTAQTTPDYASSSADAETVDTVLLTGVAGVEMAFLDIETDPLNPAWLGAWDGRAKLPAAVRVVLTFADTDRNWPDLVVETKVEEWSHCVFDEVSRKCRTGEGAG